MIKVFYHSFSDEELVDSSFELIANRLPLKFSSQAKNYRFQEDRYRYLLGKLLLEYAHAQIEGEALNWDHYQQEGLHKPTLKNGPYFNISHSGNMIVVAISQFCDLGIDTEEVKPVDTEVFTENFQSTEWHWLQSTSNKLKLIRFYQLWTRKEAVLKATGQGLSLPLTSFNVLNETVKMENGQWHLLNLRLEKDSVTHLASAKGIYDPAELEIKKCDLDVLCHSSKMAVTI